MPTGREWNGCTDEMNQESLESKFLFNIHPNHISIFKSEILRFFNHYIDYFALVTTFAWATINIRFSFILYQTKKASWIFMTCIFMTCMDDTQSSIIQMSDDIDKRNISILFILFTYIVHFYIYKKHNFT